MPEQPAEEAEWRGVAVRWVSDEPDPGWVEVQCSDARGRVWSFFDKPPMFGNYQALVPGAPYPVAARVPCRLGIAKAGARAVRVATIWVEAEDGTTEFDVAEDVLVR